MSTEEEHRRLIGTTVAGSYEILSILGKGGFATVYSARFIPLDQMVALKMMHGQLLDQRAVRAYKREIRYSGKLKHPCIAETFRAHVTDDGTPILIVELIEGVSLEKFLEKQGILTEREFFTVFDPVMNGLEFAHSRGILHCDLKPSNIMLQLSQDGTICGAKILDFGIARSLGTETLTRRTNGSFAGTPAYMSPEQCQGKRPEITSDIYSLGCMMYECLTGTPVFSEQSALAVIHAHLNNSPRPMSVAAPSLKVSKLVQSEVLGTLSKDRRRRPSCISELRSALHGHPVRRNNTEKIVRPIIIAFGIGLIAISAILAFSTLRKPDPDVLSADTASETSNLSPAPAIRTEPASMLYIHSEALVKSGNHQQAAQICAEADAALARQLHPNKREQEFRLSVKRRLATEFLRCGEIGKAKKSMEECDQLAESFNSIQRISLLIYFARVIGATDREFAIELAKKAVRLSEARLKAANDVGVEQHRVCCEAYTNLAELISASGDREAYDVWRRAIDHGDQQVSVLRKLETLREFATFLRDQNRCTEGITVMNKYKQVADSSELVEADELAYGHELQGDLFAKINPTTSDSEYAQAIEMLRPVQVDGYRCKLGTMLFKRTLSLYRIGSLKLGDGIYNECEQSFSFTRELPKDVPSTATQRNKERLAVRAAHQ